MRKKGKDSIPRGSSKREKEMIKKRVQGKSLETIAKEMKAAKITVFRTLKRLEPELREALRESNYDLNVAVNKLVEMTDAQKTEFFAHQGIVLDKRRVADNSIRLAARREMLRIHGVGNDRDERKSGGDTPSQIVINLGFLEPRRARQVLAAESGGDGADR